MIFLAPWALAIAGLSALGLVALHLVARQRPAVFLLPTTRFVPDQRTLVSRVAARPRDLLLLALRVLLVLAAGAAFAQPVLMPAHGGMARVVLIDGSRDASSADEAFERLRGILGQAVPTSIIVFDSIPSAILPTALDSAMRAPRSGAVGSLSAALVAARRAGATLAEHADSLQLILVSPLARRELDSATMRIRDQWPGAIRVWRSALRVDSSFAWRLEHELAMEDPLGPSVAAMRPAREEQVTRLIRRAPVATDSAFVRQGGTVVRWDSSSATGAAPEGLVAGGDVVVAALGRRAIASGMARARWADGTPAATERRIGAGCLREVGVAMPAAGDLALHARFQRIVRELLRPCGTLPVDTPADSGVILRLVGASTNAAPAAAMRQEKERSSTLARWLLVLAMVFALAELAVRARHEGAVT